MPFNFTLISSFLILRTGHDPKRMKHRLVVMLHKGFVYDLWNLLTLSRGPLLLSLSPDLWPYQKGLPRPQGEPLGLVPVGRELHVPADQVQGQPEGQWNANAKQTTFQAKSFPHHKSNYTKLFPSFYHV